MVHDGSLRMKRTRVSEAHVEYEAKPLLDRTSKSSNTIVMGNQELVQSTLQSIVRHGTWQDKESSGSEGSAIWLPLQWSVYAKQPGPNLRYGDP